MFRTERVFVAGLVFLLIAEIFQFPASAQSTNAANDLTQSSSFVCRPWSVEDGLPQNSVTAILQTKDGYLWLGTANGLARFDGMRFVSYGLVDGLPSLLVHVLLEDRKGALWIGTANGLSRYADGQFTNWSLKDGLAGDTIMALAEDRDGAVWVGSTSGLSRWHDGQFQTMGAAAGLEHRYVSALLADRRGSVWVAVANMGLLRWDGEQFTNVTIIPSPRPITPYRLLQDHAGTIWAGMTVGGVFRLTGDNWERYIPGSGFTGMRITALTETSDGAIWEGSLNDGIFYSSQGSLSRVTESNGLSDDAVQAIFEDHEKNIWVGTRAGGLNRLKPRQLSMWTIHDGATEVAPMSMAETPDGTLWVSSPGRRFYRLNRTNEEEFVRADLVGQQPFGAMLTAGDGSLWWGTASLLYQWKNGREAAAYRDQPLLRDDAVRCLCDNASGGLWVGTRNGKLLLLTNGQFSAFTNGPPRAALTSLTQERDGTLWIGSYGGGLGRLKDGECKVFGRADGLRSELIRALFVDSRGTLWVGTEGGGLSCFKSGTFRSFTAQQGVGDDTVVQILEDNAGNLWLGTFHGIFELLKGDADELAAGGKTQVHPRVFGRSDGMRSEQCAVGFGTCLKTHDGLLCFSTDRGIAVIDTHPQRNDSRPPLVRMEGPLMDGQVQPLPEPHPGSEASGVVQPGVLTVPAGKQRLEFRFAGLYYSAPERVCYRYQLQGLDANWIDAGNARSAYYSYVPPGKYLFRVTAHNGNGIWNENQAELAVTVLPHFWQRWWFRVAAWLVAVATAAASAAAVLRRRHKLRMQALEHQRAIERERSRIAQDMHDELGSRLTKAGMVTEMFRRELGESSDGRQRLETLKDTLQEMTVTMDELVWAVNPRHDTLDGLANYVVRFTQEFFADTAIQCVLNIPPDLPAVPLSAQIRHNLFLAFKEALTNAARHARATEVAVTIEFTNGALTLEVADNGVGFDPEQRKSGGRGLANMRDRLRATGDVCEVNSKSGCGARIRFRTTLTS